MDEASFTLRAPRPDDAPAMNAMANLPGVRAGTLRLPFTTLAQSARQLEPDPNKFQIVADIAGTAVGIVTLLRGTGRTAHSADVGMWVHDHHTGKGIGTALLRAALDLADNWLGLVRIELKVFPDNARALRLYERHGFLREGRLRAESLRDGIYADTLVMGRIHESPPVQRAAAEPKGTP